MKLDLRPMLRGEISRLPVNFTFKYDDIDFITVIGDARVNGEIVDTAGYMRMSLTLSFAVEHIRTACKYYGKSRINIPIFLCYNIFYV